MSEKPARRRRIRPPSWNFSDQWADENDVHSMPYVAGTVANREAAAIRSAGLFRIDVETDCSKSRSGRNPQRGAWAGTREPNCSKSRSGRNPQPTVVAATRRPNCSKSRSGRNPQRYRSRSLPEPYCSKSRSGRNPQLDHVSALPQHYCSKSRSGRNPQRLVRPAGCQSELESISSACKPRAAATISSSISCSPASSISSRSLDARIWVPRNVV